MIFITHPHHRHTQDFEWLWKGLGKPEDVIYGDQATLAELLPRLAVQPPPLLVLYQLEHLAPWCSQFCPVMLFPMLDCTRGTPDAFLRTLHQVEWVSFSRALHQRLASLGLSSRYLQFALDPENFPMVSWDKGLRGYFWERTPEHLDRKAAEMVFRGLGVEDYKIRSLEDEEFSENKSAERRRKAESLWEDHSTYLRYLREFQVYLAPRRFEGIGMTFLEAMAMGMCVVAENQSTADEYITGGLHGILYPGDDVEIGLPRKYSPKEMEKMGREARVHMGQLHRQWTATRESLATLAKEMIDRPYSRMAVPAPGLLEATLEFPKNPEALRAIVSLPPCRTYRSAYQQRIWGSPLGRTKFLFRKPRQFFSRLLKKGF